MRNTVRNTTKDMQDPVNAMMFLLGNSRGGSIESQEASGQRQFTDSDVLPTKGLSQESRAKLEARGFVIGGPVPGDPIFTEAKLPPGWTKKPAPDHSMWSYLYDDKGRKRASIFYKAAFYDRSSHMNFECRFRTQEDYKASKGKVVVNATDAGAVIHTITTKAADGEQSWDASARAHKKAEAWLVAQGYPAHADPFAYWT